MKPIRTVLAALLTVLPALPAAAQYRVAPLGERAVVSAPGAVAPLSAAAIVPSLSASAAAGTPLAAGASLSAPSLPAAFLPSASAPLPALPASLIPAAGAPAFSASRLPAASLPDAGRPAVPGAAAPAKAGKRVFTSLHDLAVLLQSPAGDSAGAKTYDGEGDRAAARVEYPSDGRPAPLAGHPDIAVKSVRGGLSGLQAHEVATIRKIQVLTPDLQVLVREQGATPDLVVNGIVTELKTVHKGKLGRQLAHANGQLLSHAKRHDLGRGAVVLDVIGTPVGTAEIEADIAQVLREEPEIAFDRVLVFHGDELKTYLPRDGAFRYAPGAKPFAAQEPSIAAPANAAFVPAALRRAILPDMAQVTREIQEPSALLRARGIEATVTMYGSARIPSPEKAKAALSSLTKEFGPRPKGAEAKSRLAAAREALKMSKYYQIARDLGGLIAREGAGKVAVVTGGGPGIMEGGNRGAFEAGGPSVGYNIKLPHEQGLNPYATPELEFTFENFSTRKMALRHGSMGLVYFPGGFGTMDELFEVLTLIQTGKMAKVPIVLMGERSYWQKILDFDEFAHMGLISAGDLTLFTFAETAHQAWEAIQAAHAVGAHK